MMSAVSDILPFLREREVNNVLDLGCGVGRHANYLAAQGFAAVGLDASTSGIEFARRTAAEAGLDVTYYIDPFYELPFEDASFDYVLAWNVIYHGDGAVARQTFSEVRRVLRPAGIFQATMLSKRNALYGQGREVRPNTFILDDEGEKAHAHFYCNATELIELFNGFEPLELRDKVHFEPGHYHWEFIVEKAEFQ